MAAPTRFHRRRLKEAYPQYYPTQSSWVLSCFKTNTLSFSKPRHSPFLNQDIVIFLNQDIVLFKNQNIVFVLFNQDIVLFKNQDIVLFYNRDIVLFLNQDIVLL